MHMALQINSLKINKYIKLCYFIQNKHYGKYCSMKNLKVYIPKINNYNALIYHLILIAMLQCFGNSGK